MKMSESKQIAALQKALSASRQKARDNARAAKITHIAALKECLGVLICQHPQPRHFSLLCAVTKGDIFKLIKPQDIVVEFRQDRYFGFEALKLFFEPEGNKITLNVDELEIMFKSLTSGFGQEDWVALKMAIATHFPAIRAVARKHIGDEYSKVQEMKEE